MKQISKFEEATNFDLIVVPPIPADDQGYPLLLQISAAKKAAQIYQQTINQLPAKRPLIFAQGHGVAHKFRHENCPLSSGPVTLSQQTRIMLQAFGVPADNIACGGFSHDDIGNGAELLTLLLKRNEDLKWLESLTDQPPVTQSTEVRRLKNNLENYSDNGPMQVAVLHTKHDQHFLKFITRHMFRLASVPVNLTLVEVEGPQQDASMDKALFEFCDGSIENYKENWLIYRTASEFFNALHEKHPLYNNGAIKHSTRESIFNKSHEDNQHAYDLLAALGLLSNSPSATTSSNNTPANRFELKM